MKNYSNILIALIAVAVLGIGFFIFSASNTLKESAGVTQQTAPSEVQIGSSNMQPSAEEVALVKAFPAQGASREEGIAYSEKVAQLEKETSVIEITNCIPYPFLSRVKEYTDLQIKNNDDTERTILIGQNELKVPAKDTITTKTGNGDGFTTLGCKERDSGLLHTIQVQ